MAHEPKKKHSKAVKRTRRASISLKQTHLLACKNCGQPTITHLTCRSCGFYGGKATTSPKQTVTVTKA